MANYSSNRTTTFVTVPAESWAAGCVTTIVLIVGGMLLFAAFLGMLRQDQAEHERNAPPTVEEAKAHLERIAAASKVGDFKTVCRLSSSVGSCEAQLRSAGRKVPVEPPCVSGTSQLGTGRTATLILFVQGKTRAGKSYLTQVGFTRSQTGDLRATNAVYWSGARILPKTVKPELGWAYLCTD
jgi:hypothetical protein